MSDTTVTQVGSSTFYTNSQTSGDRGSVDGTSRPGRLSNSGPSMRFKGYLYRRAVYPRRKWLKKFFVLNNGNLFEYENEGRISIVAVYDVSNCVVNVRKIKKLRFDVDTGAQVLNFRSKNIEVLLEWKTALESCSRSFTYCMEPGSAAHDAHNHNYASLPLEGRKAIGALERQLDLVKTHLNSLLANRTGQKGKMKDSQIKDFINGLPSALSDLESSVTTVIDNAKRAISMSQQAAAGTESLKTEFEKALRENSQLKENVRELEHQLHVLRDEPTDSGVNTTDNDTTGQSGDSDSSEIDFHDAPEALEDFSPRVFVAPHTPRHHRRAGSLTRSPVPNLSRLSSRRGTRYMSTSSQLMSPQRFHPAIAEEMEEAAKQQQQQQQMQQGEGAGQVGQRSAGPMDPMRRIPSPKTVSFDSTEDVSNDGSDETSEQGPAYALELTESTVKKLDLETDLPRNMLPFDKPKMKVSIWGILKQLIGRDLTKFAMPVVLCEPLSFLQRTCEEAEYYPLLHRANSTEDAAERLLYVSAFALSCYAATSNRLGKPFNPLLGETYEWISPDDPNVRFVAEQVSHHPPVSAFHCESDHFVFWGQFSPKVKFWGKHVEAQPNATVHVLLKGTGEHYVWSKPMTTVHNIVFGEMYNDTHGDMKIKNLSNGDHCVLSLMKRGWKGNNAFQVDGSVHERDGNKRFKVSGHWNSEVRAHTVSTHISESGRSFKLWTARPRPAHSAAQYNFTEFAMSLNELKDSLVDDLPPTDTRLRPDCRAFENAEIQLAGSEKARLEQKQREKAKANAKEFGKKWKWNPVWFQEQDGGWVFSGKYWQARAKRQWGQSPDIF